MLGNDQLPLPLFPFPDQLAKEPDSFKVLTESAQKFSLVEHFSELVFGLFDDGRAEGGLVFLHLLLLLAVVRVLLRSFRRAICTGCFSKLETTNVVSISLFEDILVILLKLHIEV
jgi:hypothetical protein